MNHNNTNDQEVGMAYEVKVKLSKKPSTFPDDDPAVWYQSLPCTEKH